MALYGLKGSQKKNQICIYNNVNWYPDIWSGQLTLGFMTYILFDSKLARIYTSFIYTPRAIKNATMFS